MQHISVTLWVDEAEAELTKLDMHLTVSVPIGWFGALGTLKQYHLAIERTRLPDGVWVNKRTTLLFVARLGFSTERVKITEESSDFRRETATDKLGASKR